MEETCRFFVKKKQTNCRFSKVPGFDFCHSHIPSENRIKCPLDNSTSLMADNFLSHLNSCNKARDISFELSLPFYNHNCNLPNASIMFPNNIPTSHLADDSQIETFYSRMLYIYSIMCRLDLASMDLLDDITGIPEVLKATYNNERFWSNAVNIGCHSAALKSVSRRLRTAADKMFAQSIKLNTAPDMASSKLSLSDVIDDPNVYPSNMTMEQCAVIHSHPIAQIEAAVDATPNMLQRAHLLLDKHEYQDLLITVLGLETGVIKSPVNGVGSILLEMGAGKAELARWIKMIRDEIKVPRLNMDNDNDDKCCSREVDGQQHDASSSMRVIVVERESRAHGLETKANRDVAVDRLSLQTIRLRLDICDMDCGALARAIGKNLNLVEDLVSKFKRKVPLTIPCWMDFLTIRSQMLHNARKKGDLHPEKKRRKLENCSELNCGNSITSGQTSMDANEKKFGEFDDNGEGHRWSQEALQKGADYINMQVETRPDVKDDSDFFFDVFLKKAVGNANYDRIDSIWKDTQKILSSTNHAQPQAHQQTDLVFAAKHLCGGGSDVTLQGFRQAIEAGNGNLSCSLLLATCCHHRCDLRSFVNKEFLMRSEDENGCGMTEDEVRLLFSVTSWATTGNERSSLKVRLGRVCKRIVDAARVDWLRHVVGLKNARQVRFVSEEISPENVCLIANCV